MGEVARLRADLAEMTRRRDEWRFKAQGFDAVRLALREKVGTPWPPHLSRVMWAGIAADEKKRADDAEADRATLAPCATVGLAALAYYMTGSDMDGETLEDVLIGAGVLNGERVAVADEADVRAAISRAGEA